MSEMPIDFLVRGDGTKILPITSLDAVMEGNKTLRTILNEKLSEKLDKIKRGTNSAIYNDLLVSNIKMLNTGIVKIGLPSDATLAENSFIEIYGINKNKDINLSIAFSFNGTAFNGNAFCTNTSAIDGEVNVGAYGGKKCILLGKETSEWENALFFIKFVSVDNTTTDWNTGYSIEIIENFTPIANKTKININSEFSVSNTETVGGYRVDDNASGADEQNNALWTANKIMQIVSSVGSSISMCDLSYDSTIEGQEKFVGTSSSLLEYSETNPIIISLNKTSTAPTLININNLGDVPLQKIQKNGITGSLQKNDVIKGAYYWVKYFNGKFILLGEDKSNLIELAANSSPTTSLTVDADSGLPAVIGSLKTNNEKIVYPRTKFSAVLDENGKNVEERLAEKLGKVESGHSSIAIINEDGSIGYSDKTFGGKAIEAEPKATVLSTEKAVNDFVNNKIQKEDEKISKHIQDGQIHVTSEEKQNWNDKADSSELESHTRNSEIHVTSSDKDNWNGKSKVARFSAKFLSNSWTGESAPFSQEVVLEGMLSSDVPLIDLSLSSPNEAQISKNEIEAFLMAGYVEAAEGKIILKCYDGKPTTDFIINIEVVR